MSSDDRVRNALEALVAMIEATRPVDSHGHDIRLSSAFIDAKIALEVWCPPKPN